AFARETHTKQLEIPRPGCAAAPARIIYVEPALTVEPLATHYFRRAEAYRFVRRVLEDTFRGALSSARRLTPRTPSKVPLDEELHFMEALFRGACATACRELGEMPEVWFPSLAGSAQRDAESFAAWAASIADDPDIVIDARMMVPVFYD